MHHTDIHQAYFSATGTTKTIVEAIGNEFSGAKTSYDILRRPLQAPVALASDALAIVGVPVYSGRVPAIAMESVSLLQGKNTPAIAVAVYGNRDYEDALLELTNTLTAKGFAVIGAGAFIARHSIFPQVAANRPDKEDMRRIAEFAAQCRGKLKKTPDAASLPALSVKGDKPYRDVSPGALKPSLNDSCTLCGQCVAICPTKALRIEDNSLERTTALCIACAACIAECPAGAQAFRGPEYEAFGAKFAENFSARKEPETFL